MSQHPSSPDHTEKWNLDEGFRVGEWVALPRSRTLSRGDETIRPEPKVMDILVCLARHHRDVVTREQFAEEVWPGVIVSEEVLTRGIHLLRMHLGDDPKAPSYIQTISRRGYRLISELAPLSTEKVASGDPTSHVTPQTGDLANGSGTDAQPSRWPNLPVLITLAALLTAGAAGVWWWPRAPSPVQAPPPALDINTIAVLPFDTVPGESEVFGDGLADQIRVSLNTIPTLRIIPGMSVQSFAGPQDNPTAIGKKLNAGSILMGSVRQNGDRLKVMAWLIDTSTGIQSWSNSYAEQRVTDLFKVQSDISRAIATQLKVKFDTTIETPPTNDPVAYTEFLQARQMLHRRGAAPIESSIRLFNQAIERDPKFGKAYIGLAEALIVAPSYTGEPEAPMYDRATAALDHADSLGATEPPAHAIRAYVDTRRWLWFDAAKEFDIARSSDPNDSDLWQYYSQFLAYTGDFAGATDAAREATRLDPLSPIAHQRLGVMYLWQDDYQHAGQEFEMADELGLPSEANPEISVALLLWMKQFDEARARLIAIQRIRHKGDAWVGPAVKAVARQGDDAKGIAALRSAHASGAINDRLYLGALMLIGDPDSFFSAIEDAVANHVPFDVEIMFLDRSSALRRQPRFATLMEQIGLIEYWDANRWPPACARNGSLVECH